MQHLRIRCASRWLAALLLAALLTTEADLGPLGGQPAAFAMGSVLGPTPWAVVLCKYADAPSTVPYPPAYYVKMFTTAGKGTGNVIDYWSQMSYNHVNLDDSQVFGRLDSRFGLVLVDWYTMPYRQQDEWRQATATTTAGSVMLTSTTAAFAPSDVSKLVGGAGIPAGAQIRSVVDTTTATLTQAATASGSTAISVYKWRDWRLQDCIDTGVANDPKLAGFSRVVGVVNTAWGKDWGSTGIGNGRVLLDPTSSNMMDATHEMGHGYGLNHSFDTLNLAIGRVCGNAAPGEYCDKWDVMSVDNVFQFTGLNYGEVGPSLIAASRADLGWMDSSRLDTTGVGETGVTGRTITLAAVNHPEVPGSLLAEIWTGSFWYAVEFHAAEGWDGAIPRDAVLIHKFIYHDFGGYGAWVPALVDDQGPADKVAGATFRDVASNLQIRVNAIDGGAEQATVTIALDHAVEGPGPGGRNHPVGCKPATYCYTTGTTPGP